VFSVLNAQADLAQACSDCGPYCSGWCKANPKFLFMAYLHVATWHWLVYESRKVIRRPQQGRCLEHLRFPVLF